MKKAPKKEKAKLTRREFAKALEGFPKYDMGKIDCDKEYEEELDERTQKPAKPKH